MFINRYINLNGLYCLVVCMIFPVVLSHAQTEIHHHGYPLNFQQGVTLKVMVEFTTKKGVQKPVLYLAASTGVSSDFLTRAIHPSFNVELLFYNGGLGAGDNRDRSKFHLDAITALTMTAGFRNRLNKGRRDQVIYNNVPLYYFSNFAAPSLLNPFDCSVSVGTNLIFTTHPDKTNQRVGFFNLHVYKGQVSYYNDGGVPFYNIYLGDRRDRYYTGGAVISYHGKSYAEVNLVELAYNKFTGYSSHAFEVSNLLDLAFVDYQDVKQRYFNRSVWSVNIANPVKGYGVQVRGYNHVNLDIQHKIHWSIFNAYHLSPYPSYITISGSYYGANKIL